MGLLQIADEVERVGQLKWRYAGHVIRGDVQDWVEDYCYGDHMNSGDEEENCQ